MLLTAAAVFAGTNIDDLVVLTLLFVAGTRRSAIWAGQYLGIAALVAVSAAGALGLTVVPDGWVRWLGLIPVALGVKGFIQARNHDEETPPAGTLLSVARVTIANGGDNIAVYTPLLRTVGVGDALVVVAVFAVLVAVWCLVASRLGAHPKVVALAGRAGPWLTPVVFVTLGAVILLDLL